MKFPISWLNELLPNSKSLDELVLALTKLGLEVESVDSQEAPFKKVVVGEIIECVPHTDSEKLTIAQVSNGSEVVQVVCGAPNCRKGLKTAFCQVGGRVGDFKIKKAKLRGVESHGMLCSEQELGLSDQGEGIVEFSGREVGEDLSASFADNVIHLGITPNLGHCASVFGVARELAALIGEQPTLPERPFNEVGKNPALIKLETENCPRYACRVIKGVTVKSSPEWLQKRLLATGIRPINNVVDVTNYVLMEIGHPLHAFDLAKVNNVVVRMAKDGEKIVTLDEQERTLTSDVLVITDGAEPVAVAGVMGGINSEVKEGTTDILIESAYFNPAAVRKGSKHFGLPTEASRRFERGADPQNVLVALDRAAGLISELAGGEVSEILDVQQKLFPPKTIECRLNRVNAFLGTAISSSEVEEIFHKLNFGVSLLGNTLTVTVPTYRADVNEEIDLIEEVLRLWGFENVPQIEPRHVTSPVPHTSLYPFLKQVRGLFIGAGLSEVITCDLIGPEQLDWYKGDVVKVMNPGSVEQSVLRPSLLPGLLDVTSHNVAHRSTDFAVFEIGRIHLKEGDNYKEFETAGVLLTGAVAPYHFEQKPGNVDFFTLKGILETVLAGLGFSARFEKGHFDILHPGRQAIVFVGEDQIGTIGEVHPRLRKRTGSRQRLYYAELELHTLLRLQQSEQKMNPLPQFPYSERDWTITLDETVTFDEIKSRLPHSRILEQVTLKDIYRSEKIGVDKKNVTLNFVYRDKKKTLSQEQVDKEHERLTRSQQ